MKEAAVISAYHARIGRSGGRRSSPAKTAAARAAANKRWGREPDIKLPVEALADGRWYSGAGRNSDMGLWDARRGCFWVVSVSDQVDPLRYPEPGERSVRLKREGHVDHGGSFHPRREVG
jgi:hypothetical protein